jgi:hypothetical protein
MKQQRRSERCPLPISRMNEEYTAVGIIVHGTNSIQHPSCSQYTSGHIFHEIDITIFRRRRLTVLACYESNWLPRADDKSSGALSLPDGDDDP